MDTSQYSLNQCTDFVQIWYGRLPQMALRKFRLSAIQFYSKVQLEGDHKWIFHLIQKTVLKYDIQTFINCISLFPFLCYHYSLPDNSKCWNGKNYCHCKGKKLPSYINNFREFQQECRRISWTVIDQKQH